MTSLYLLVCTGALIASLNPCTLSVIIMSISSLVGKGKNPRHAALYIALFTLGTFTAYATTGMLLSFGLSHLPARFVGLFGILEVKDYFWYGKGLSFKLSEKAEGEIHRWTKRHHSALRGYLLGIYTALRLSHYTIAMIAVYAVLFVLVPSSTFLPMPVVWAIWYVLPLLFISVLVASGANVHALTMWKEDSKHTMRLSTGLLYIALGWVLLVYLSGGVSLA
jgi:cytochrome c biogenesis protein CcdA